MKNKDSNNKNDRNKKKEKKNDRNEEKKKKNKERNEKKKNNVKTITMMTTMVATMQASYSTKQFRGILSINSSTIIPIFW